MENDHLTGLAWPPSPPCTNFSSSPVTANSPPIAIKEGAFAAGERGVCDSVRLVFRRGVELPEEGSSTVSARNSGRRCQPMRDRARRLAARHAGALTSGIL